MALSASFGVKVYNLADGKILYELAQEVSHQYQGIYSYIAWSPDGKNLAIGKPNNGVRVIDVDSWKILTEADEERYPLYLLPGFSWSPDGSELALGTGENEIRIWNKNTNFWITKTGCDKPQVSITWNLDGRLLIFSYDGLYDQETCNRISNIGTDAGYGYAVWPPDKKHIYIFFDLGGGVTGVAGYNPKFGTCCYSEVAWSYDSRFFAATAERSNEISIWDTVTEKVVLQENQGDMIFAFAWSPSGDLLALGSKDGKDVLWNTHTREIVLELSR